MLLRLIIIGFTALGAAAIASVLVVHQRNDINTSAFLASLGAATELFSFPFLAGGSLAYFGSKSAMARIWNAWFKITAILIFLATVTVVNATQASVWDFGYPFIGTLIAGAGGLFVGINLVHSYNLSQRLRRLLNQREEKVAIVFGVLLLVSGLSLQVASGLI